MIVVKLAVSVGRTVTLASGKWRSTMTAGARAWVLHLEVPLAGLFAIGKQGRVLCLWSLTISASDVAVPFAICGTR